MQNSYIPFNRTIWEEELEGRHIQATIHHNSGPLERQHKTWLVRIPTQAVLEKNYTELLEVEEQSKDFQISFECTRSQ
jgi:hypothetical protein